MTADKETATKAAQCADLLHYATSILHRFVTIEQELKRLAEVLP